MSLLICNGENNQKYDEFRLMKCRIQIQYQAKILNIEILEALDVYLSTQFGRITD